jgi:hypothetical protein
MWQEIASSFVESNERYKFKPWKTELDRQISCGDASTLEELRENGVLLLIQHSDYILQRQGLL